MDRVTSKAPSRRLVGYTRGQQVKKRGVRAEDPSESMKDGNHQVTIQINLGLNPFGQASLALGYAHPDRFQRDSDEKIALTQVMPLMSSAITPGYARPASV